MLSEMIKYFISIYGYYESQFLWYCCNINLVSRCDSKLLVIIIFIVRSNQLSHIDKMNLNLFNIYILAK